jgi:polar amino acid transport system substrate-binding protein
MIVKLARLFCAMAVAMVASLTFAAPAADARTLQEILSAKKIRLGTLPYPPMTQIDSRTGKLSGIWADGPKFLFEQLGLEVEFVETKWATFASGLQSNQFDVFVGGSFATPKRAAAVDFSRPVMFMGHSIAVRKENEGKYKTMADIDQPGVTIATVLGSSGHEYTREHFKRATIRALDTGDLTAGALEVLAGRADAALQDSFKIGQVVGLHPTRLVDLFANHPFHVLFVSYTVAKGNRELLQLINTSLDWMDSTGKWQELAAPYKDQLAGVFFIHHAYKPFSGPSAKAE